MKKTAKFIFFLVAVSFSFQAKAADAEMEKYFQKRFEEMRSQMPAEMDKRGGPILLSAALTKAAKEPIYLHEIKEEELSVD